MRRLNSGRNLPPKLQAKKDAAQHQKPRAPAKPAVPAGLARIRYAGTSRPQR